MRHILAMATVCMGAMMATAATGAFAPVRADGDSALTLGVGGGIGIHKAAGPDEKADTAFVNQASVRLKFLWVLGVDYSYDLTRDAALQEPTAGELHYQAKMRLTALLYPYSGEYVAFYLGAGIGGGHLQDLAKFDAPANSYHAGMGFEFHLADHFSIDMSFMLVAPGMKSIESAAVARVEAALASGGTEAVAKLEAPGLDEFVSLKNHEFMVRLFLFL